MHVNLFRPELRGSSGESVGGTVWYLRPSLPSWPRFSGTQTCKRKADRGTGQFVAVTLAEGVHPSRALRGTPRVSRGEMQRAMGRTKVGVY